jgi:hypothetical protein
VRFRACAHQKALAGFKLFITALLSPSTTFHP